MNVWRNMWAAYVICAHRGHVWGERLWWGDAQRERGGTHRCNRCGRTGWPAESPRGDDDDPDGPGPRCAACSGAGVIDVLAAASMSAEALECGAANEGNRCPDCDGSGRPHDDRLDGPVTPYSECDGRIEP